MKTTYTGFKELWKKIEIFFGALYFKKNFVIEIWL